MLRTRGSVLNINLRDKYGFTALIHVLGKQLDKNHCDKGHLMDIAIILIDMGALISEFQFSLPLLLALRHGYDRVVTKLLNM